MLYWIHTECKVTFTAYLGPRDLAVRCYKCFQQELADTYSHISTPSGISFAGEGLRGSSQRQYVIYNVWLHFQNNAENSSCAMGYHQYLNPISICSKII